MHVALFAEVDPNLVEGPAVWLVAVAASLARQGVAVTVLLRARRTGTAVLAPLDGLPGVELVDPYALGWTHEARRGALSVSQAAEFLERLDLQRSFDAIIIRGSMAATAVGRRARLRGRLAFYLTDFPQDERAFGWWARWRLRRVLASASLLCCQTPEIAAYLERVLKQSLPTVPLPPIIDDEVFSRARATAPSPSRPLSLVYVGKFAPTWNTLEMTLLPEALKRQGVPVELHVAGDKFLSRPDPNFPARMRTALARPGLVWHGALPRSDAQSLAAAGHVGLSWRAADLDCSLEISTKLLEYGAVGLPAVCNPTAMHRRLLGEDYPAFARTFDEAVGAIMRLRDHEVWHQAANAMNDVAQAHREAVIAPRLALALKERFQ